MHNCWVNNKFILTEFIVVIGLSFLFLSARLASVNRPQLNHLDANIFPNHGLFPKEIVEIAGDVGLGKTTILMHIMAKTIMPLICGGKEGEVIFLMTEHSYDMEKFVTVLGKCIGECKTTTNESETDLLTTSLEKLTIQRCFDETQFELAIHNLHRMLQENNRYCLLAIDNIASFYYTSKSRERGQMFYLNDVLSRLRMIVNDYNLALVYTKPAYFDKKSMRNRPDGVNYFLELIDKNAGETDKSNLVYKVDIPVINQITLRQYEFDVNGCIEWME